MWVELLVCFFQLIFLNFLQLAFAFLARSFERIHRRLWRLRCRSEWNFSSSFLVLSCGREILCRSRISFLYLLHWFLYFFFSDFLCLCVMDSAELSHNKKTIRNFNRFFFGAGRAFFSSLRWTTCSFFFYFFLMVCFPACYRPPKMWDFCFV